MQSGRWTAENCHYKSSYFWCPEHTMSQRLSNLEGLWNPWKLKKMLLPLYYVTPVAVDYKIQRQKGELLLLLFFIVLSLTLLPRHDFCKWYSSLFFRDRASFLASWLSKRTWSLLLKIHIFYCNIQRWLNCSVALSCG